MPKDIIPKAENTGEIVQANLLKYTFIAKRQVLHRNQIPAKFRNNINAAIKQTEKERAGLIRNLNISLHPSKLNEDNVAHEEIVRLYNREMLAEVKLKKLRTMYIDLKREVCRWQKKEKSMQSRVKQFELRAEKERKTYGDMEQTLYRKINMYNDGVKKQNELRELYESLRKETSQKRNIYDTLMFQLNKEARIAVNVGEEGIKSYQERENKLTALETLQESNEMEIRQRKEKIFMTKYKLRNDLDQTEFLEIRNTLRHNRHADKVNGQHGNLDEKNRRKKTLAFVKYLIHIGGDTDLKTIIDNLEKINLDKQSLFSLLIFFEQQFSVLDGLVGDGMKTAAEKTRSNDRRNELYECQIKSYLEQIQVNERTINEKETFTNSLRDLYNEVNERIYGIFQALRCDPSAVERFGAVVPLNEYNIVDYAKEMEKKSVELLYKVNCIENSCLTGQNEDPLTSDAESQDNLITKDYNCVEIKMHRFLNMSDNATLPVPVVKLDLGTTPSPCPHCIETRFIEDGPCNLLSTSETNMDKQSSRAEIPKTCCADVIKQLDFNKMNPKIAVLLHDKNNCRKIQQM